MQSPLWKLVRSFFRCAARMNGYAHHGRPQNASVKNVAWLKNLQNRAVFVLHCLGAIHRLMKMRIKGLAKRIDAFDAEPGDVVNELLVDELEAFAIILILGFAMSRESMLKAVNDRDEPLDDARRVTLGIVGAFLFDALAIVVEIGLAAHERLAEFVEVADEFRDFGIGRRGIAGELCVFELLLACVRRAAFSVER